MRRATIAALMLGGAACAGAVSDGDRETGPAQRNDVWFHEVTDELLPAQDPERIDGTHAIIEITGSGVGLLDFDGDGDLDIYQVRQPPPGAPDAEAPNRLFRQETDGTFTEVRASGLEDPGFGQGLAVGDVSGDGRPDVYVTNLGTDALYLNRGDGTFAPAAIPSAELWSTAAAFCDYDADGDLDLFVTHYVDYDPRAVCMDDAGAKDYCGPARFDGVADRLLRNDGAAWRDVTTEAGIRPQDGGRSAKGLGVVCTDLTGDGLADFYVANDGEPNQLWVNDGNGRFDEQAMERGAGVNRYGEPESSMGIAVADVDGDAELDLFMTHLTGQNNTLYRGGSAAQFADRTAEMAIAVHDFPMTGFGCVLADFDLDGDPDLAVANGRVYRAAPVAGARLGPFWNDYAERDQLFENLGGGRFEDAASRGGRFTAVPAVSRALAAGDLDGDGDVDLVLTHNDGALRAFRNDAPRDGRHWLAVRPRSGGRDEPGIRVTLRDASGARQVAPVLPGSSYLSSHEPRVVFGVSGDGSWSVEVRWLDGTIERFEVDGVDRELVVERGRGIRP